jgi:Fe-Mn family superoxide dismutase
MTAGTPAASLSLEEVVKQEKGKVFNMAAQIWNHTFYWESMTPNGGGQPTGKLLELINQTWGSFDAFKTKFTEEAANHFGSGWAWLVRDAHNNLSIESSHDAGCPLTEGKTPLLTCDVWEHAYYIDRRNNRAAYIDAWWNLVNWDHATKQLAQ